ncbi:MAG: hypothetical protein MUE68_10345 [Bacteroidetes bacterium]|jgi:hypothetical protein|nr:hypothetical protein [Bacteroidota bacterium]
MTRHRFSALGAALLILATGLTAGGPVYSRYGFGDLLWFGSSRTWAMGGGGLALRGEGFINLANPAANGGLLRTRFDASFGYTSFWSEQGGGRSIYGLGGLQSVAIGFPIDVEHGVALAISTGPVSRVGYTVRRDDLSAEVPSIQSFFGRGGLSSIGLDLSATILPSVHVGMGMDYLYGRIRQFTKIDLQDPTFVDEEIERSGYHQGLQFTLGATVELQESWLGLPVTLGMTASLPTHTSIEQNDIFLAIDTVLQSRGEASLPLRLGFGAAGRIGNRVNVIADVVYEGWSGMEVFGRRQAEMRNALRLSAGAELLPRTGDVSYWQRIAYRIGAGYAQTYLQLNGVGINDLFGTAGVSLPIGPDARLNLGVQAGLRGTTDSGLQRDTYLQLSVGFSASEMWFVNFEED